MSVKLWIITDHLKPNLKIGPLSCKIKQKTLVKNQLYWHTILQQILHVQNKIMSFQLLIIIRYVTSSFLLPSLVWYSFCFFFLALLVELILQKYLKSWLTKQQQKRVNENQLNKWKLLTKRNDLEVVNTKYEKPINLNNHISSLNNLLKQKPTEPNYPLTLS